MSPSQDPQSIDPRDAKVAAHYPPPPTFWQRHRRLHATVLVLLIALIVAVLVTISTREPERIVIPARPGAAVEPSEAPRPDPVKVSQDAMLVEHIHTSVYEAGSMQADLCRAVRVMPDEAIGAFRDGFEETNTTDYDLDEAFVLAAFLDACAVVGK